MADTVKNQALMIEKLNHQLKGMAKHRFGSKSETAGQLGLKLFEQEADEALMDEAANPGPTKDTDQKPKRERLPSNLPRQSQRVEPDQTQTCEDCSGKQHYLWRAIDHEGEVLDCVVTKKRDRKAALKILKKLLWWYGPPGQFMTDKLASYGAPMRDLGFVGWQVTAQYANNLIENSDSLPGKLLAQPTTERGGTSEGRSRRCVSFGPRARCRNSYRSSLFSKTTSTINAT